MTFSKHHNKTFALLCLRNKMYSSSQISCIFHTCHVAIFHLTCKRQWGLDSVMAKGLNARVSVFDLKILEVCIEKHLKFGLVPHAFRSEDFRRLWITCNIFIVPNDTVNPDLPSMYGEFLQAKSIGFNWELRGGGVQDFPMQVYYGFRWVV